MPKTKLKPCPFCGGESYYRKPEHLKGTAFDVMRIECKNCGAVPYAVETYEFNTEEKKKENIARFWNRRAENETDVEAEPVKHGEWIQRKVSGRYECSCCHSPATITITLKEYLSDYCPNCGAKMDGGDVCT